MLDSKAEISAKQVDDWMVSYICTVLNLPKENFRKDERFDRLGLDSVEAVIMAGMMEEEFSVQIDPMELFENPSVTAFVAHFTKSRLSAA